MVGMQARLTNCTCLKSRLTGHSPMHLSAWLFMNYNFFPRKMKIFESSTNKANLRDLIAATGLVISNWIQIVNFSTRVTAKSDRWPRKTIGHFFYTTSSFVHRFKSIGEFKLDLQSRNAQFGSKLVICYPVWHEIWWMTLENNRAPLLCYFKLCVSFRTHWWIQSGVTVRKRPIWVKSDGF